MYYALKDADGQVYAVSENKDVLELLASVNTALSSAEVIEIEYNGETLRELSKKLAA
jgi:hypothetical protein